MTEYPYRLLLVTGTPRSGTTAVGQMLSLGPGIRPLHEPFNYIAGMIEIERYFEIPGTASFSQAKLNNCIERIHNLDLQFKTGFFARDRGLERFIKYFIGGRTKNSYRLCKIDPCLKTIIWKDPFACFSADYVSKYYDVETFVTLRNPWAVAGSFKRMGWSFNLTDIIDRLKALGFDFTNQLFWLTEASNTSAMNGALLWYVVNSTLLQWSRSNERIQFLNLDDIILSPTQTYSKLYALLELSWNTRIASRITKYYEKTSASEQPRVNKAHVSNRNISTMNTYWQSILDEVEKDKVSHLTEELWGELKEACVQIG
jgi:hypothetical protein